jgi:putative transposase
MTIIDAFTGEALAVKVDSSPPTLRIINIFDLAGWERNVLETFSFNQGLQFAGFAMHKWGAEHQVNLHSINPWKPTQNAQLEPFNGRVREELLNSTAFPDLFVLCAAAIRIAH